MTPRERALYLAERDLAEKLREMVAGGRVLPLDVARAVTAVSRAAVSVSLWTENPEPQAEPTAPTTSTTSGKKR